MISIKSTGDWKKTSNFFKRIINQNEIPDLNKYGQMGVDALASATPTDTGLTANSWSYEIVKTDGKVSIYWTNSNIQNGIPIAVILQYGHATGTGGYVQGVDYINPAIRPIFDSIAQEAWREVVK